MEKIIQGVMGYRFSMEPFFLVNFIIENITFNTDKRYRLLDVGTGSGIIPRLLLEKYPFLHMYCIEIQKSLFEKAKANLRNKNWNISVIHDDFNKDNNYFKGPAFDFILSNPPYRKLQSGRKNPSEEKAIARHELCLTLEELIRKSSCILKSLGKMIMIYHTSRMTDLVILLKKYHLNPEKMQIIYKSCSSGSKIFLIESRKDGKGCLEIKEPIFIYDNKQKYTERIVKMYDFFVKVP